jgi:hypothetical protein
VKQTQGTTTTTLRGRVINDAAQYKQHQQPKPEDPEGLTPSITTAHSATTKSTRRGRKKKLLVVQEEVQSNLTQQMEDTSMEEVTNNESLHKEEKKVHF